MRCAFGQTRLKAEPSDNYADTHRPLCVLSGYCKHVGESAYNKYNAWHTNLAPRPLQGRVLPPGEFNGMMSELTVFQYCWRQNTITQKNLQ